MRKTTKITDIYHIYFIQPLIVLEWKGYDFNKYLIFVHFFIKRKVGVLQAFE